jgi:hypothetical protein
MHPVVVVEAGAGAGAGEESPPNRKRKIRYDLVPLTTELKLFPCIFSFSSFFKKHTVSTEPSIEEL